MTRILVGFASHYGQTQKIAERIATHLGILGHEITLLDLTSGRDVDPATYDAVVLGSRIEMERHAKQLVAFIAEHRDDLERAPTAVFAVSMSAAKPQAGPDPNGYLAKLVAQTGWMPVLQRAFAGGLPYRKYNWFTRWMMKSISKRTHATTDTSRDHEFTDWDAVRAFALEIDALCAPTSRAASDTPCR